MSLSSTFAMYKIGFAVMRPSPRTTLASSSENSSVRSGFSSSAWAEQRLITSTRSFASLSPPRAARSDFGRAFFNVSMSASSNSISIISISDNGFTPPVTCVTSSSSKQRTTCKMASTSRMWLRNLFPSPSPLLAPSTIPAMSTSFRTAGMIFCGGMYFVIVSSRLSGTLTMPSFGSMVQNG